MSLLTSILAFASPILHISERKREMNMEEIWKDIRGYEGRYQVSNLGNVKSLNYKGHGYEKNLTPKINNKGYLHVQLSKNRTIKYFLIHRLVAEAFIDNPSNFPLINHKDENPKNNNENNLEWCTSLYNVGYSLNLHQERRERKYFKASLKYRKHDKELIKMDKKENELEKCGILHEYCKKNNLNNWSIIQCCNEKRKTAYGYKWRFADK